MVGLKPLYLISRIDFSISLLNWIMSVQGCLYFSPKLGKPKRKLNPLVLLALTAVKKGVRVGAIDPTHYCTWSIGPFVHHDCSMDLFGVTPPTEVD